MCNTFAALIQLTFPACTILIDMDSELNNYEQG